MERKSDRGGEVMGREGSRRESGEEEGGECYGGKVRKGFGGRQVEMKAR